MFQHILIPVDGSPFSASAVRHAGAVARRAGARILLLHVHPPVLVPEFSALSMEATTGWDQEIRDAQSRHLDELARKLRDDGLDVRTEILDGEVASAIIERSRCDADLLVMATHGAGGLAGAWLGSVTDTVIHHVTLPALLVRPEEGETGEVVFERILVATDGSPAAEASTEQAVNLARMFDAGLTLLRVVPVPAGPASPYIPHAARLDRDLTREREEEAERGLAAVSARIGGSVRLETRVVRAYHTARAILEAIEESGADLIAVGTHRRTRLARIVLGSVADKVLRAAPVPVLIGHAAAPR